MKAWWDSEWFTEWLRLARHLPMNQEPEPYQVGRPKDHGKRQFKPDYFPQSDFRR
jgi:hypothetical protein